MAKMDFSGEMRYQLTMSFVKQLKKDGIISDKEYHQIDTILHKKHRPVLSTLLSGNSLT